MKILNCVLIVGLVWVMFLSTAVAGSFRCGSHLIEEGMERSKVREYCGEPASENGWTWHYDRGAGSMNMLVHFDADGTVNRIEEDSEG